MYGYNILCGISKGTFEIPHRISYPYIERCRFYSQVKIEELLDLRAVSVFETHTPPPPHRRPLEHPVHPGIWSPEQVKNMFAF